MTLPILPPYPPMEALSVNKIPVDGGWQYEPKWDGFRCLAFRDGDDIEVQSKSGQPLARYFPEVVQSLRDLDASQFVFDGEIVIPVDGSLSFDDLLLRIHPAASRVQKLAAESPAVLLVFDLLVDTSGTLLADLPLSHRRPALEEFARASLKDDGPIRLSPASPDVAVAHGWFGTVGGGMDGIIAKRLDLPYQSGERTGMQKIKRMSTADCVIGGFRYGEKGNLVGSMLLGLYDDEGLLNHVGFCSSIKTAERKALTEKLEALVQPPGFTGRKPGGPSRWSTKRSEEWQPLAPTLVAEFQWDHFTGGRFRHGTKLLRWRPDKDARQCTMQQVSKNQEVALGLF